MFPSLWLLLLIFFFPTCNSTDTINPNEPVRDGETLVSAGGKFALGFFSPGSSKNRYVGIRYNNIPDQTVVWVANRENPVKNSSGVVLTVQGGNLVLVDDVGIRTAATTTLWSTNVSTATNSSTATLTDSGNLILRDGHQRVLWQSFDHLTDTYLPMMKLGLDRRAGLNWVLTSWRSADDPAPGEFSLGLDLHGLPQFFLKKGGSVPVWRNGPWNIMRLHIERGTYQNTIHGYGPEDDEIYLSPHNNSDDSIIWRAVLEVSGVLRSYKWNYRSRQWDLLQEAPGNACDRYAHCGAYGICDSNRMVECTCLRGYEPKAPGNWRVRDWSDGCVRRKPLDCGGKGDGFFRLARVRLPDTRWSRVEPSLSIRACEEECLKSCSCTGYASANTSEDRNGCMLWYGNLTDAKASDDGIDLHIRMAASELDKSLQSGGFQGKKKLLVTIFTVIPLMLLFYLCGYCLWRKKAKARKINERPGIALKDNDIEESRKGLELPLFDFHVIEAATNNFSESNLLGKGGFGAVYKGWLLNGQEIAVKRLSKNSGQGIEQFKNEVTLIAKLQHKNLVRLLGYCMSGEEKILIYEYLRNKSLDSLIFDQTRSIMLDWKKRFNIIMGIARGILYLHEDSRFKIIHRDLKVSNILLDDEMNPKISDFGMARIFGGNQTQGNTTRVVGTYGYMSPEYVMHGLFSVKSDAYSFGVLLLEIICGKMNNCHNDSRSMNLIGHVWELWKDARVLEVVDSSMNTSPYESEVLRCIRVGLLCVQEKSKDRPNFSSIVFMLGNETTMPSPNQPAFCFSKGNHSEHPHTTNNTHCSLSEVTITKMEPR